MAYKKYFYKNGKKFGPYYYESYRDKSGKVKKRYVGTTDPYYESLSERLLRILGFKNLLFGLFFIFIIIFVFLFISFYTAYSIRHGQVTGFFSSIGGNILSFKWLFNSGNEILGNQGGNQLRTSDGACDCTGKVCGDDGCGGSCGNCTLPETCQSDGTCLCIPNCTGKVCGDDDGCGGLCDGDCPIKYQASSLCNSGICDYTCYSGYGDCNYDISDGCETDTSMDNTNCGICGNNCPFPALCQSGECKLTSLCIGGIYICQNDSNCTGGQICKSGVCSCPNGTSCNNGTNSCEPSPCIPDCAGKCGGVSDGCTGTCSASCGSSSSSSSGTGGPVIKTPDCELNSCTEDNCYLLHEYKEVPCLLKGKNIKINPLEDRDCCPPGKFCNPATNECEKIETPQNYLGCGVYYYNFNTIQYPFTIEHCYQPIIPKEFSCKGKNYLAVYDMKKKLIATVDNNDLLNVKFPLDGNPILCQS
jgi:hypothetical protein